ncbi:MAG: hypothetical protein AB1295_05335 [Candidatus Micrarchaeota archaeon]
MARRFIKPYSFDLSKMDMAPILMMQTLAQQDTALSTYLKQAVASESIMRGQRDLTEASVMARAVSERSSKEQEKGKGEKEATTSYTITYYNPELRKTEVIKEKASIETKDIATKVIEESVGMHSGLPVYSFIAQPMMRKGIVTWKLQQILSGREYGTPRPPPTGAALIPVRVVAVKAEEKRRDKNIRALIAEAIVRKEKSESKLDEEIVLMEETVDAIRGGDAIEKLIRRLPPLSRARYILLLRKKKLSKSELIRLFIHDLAFLKMLKKKLELFTLEELVAMYKMLRSLQRR